MAAMLTAIKLWFDVEKRYKAITSVGVFPIKQLWFDVVKRYKAIV